MDCRSDTLEAAELGGFSGHVGQREFRRMTKVTYCGQMYGTKPRCSDAPPRPGRDHQRLLGDGLPFHPAAIWAAPSTP